MSITPAPITLMVDSAAPLVALNVRVPEPLLRQLEEQAAILNANRAAIARYALILGIAELKRQSQEFTV
jgi:hypothetical protein